MTSAIGVRREKAALYQWVQVPPGAMLQPEATGAIVEVTKRLKPSVVLSRNTVTVPLEPFATLWSGSGCARYCGAVSAQR